ncbi:MAG: universal stress protein [Chloroflexota bacterium]
MKDLPPLLIALQSDHPSFPALEYGENLAKLLRTPVRLLCVRQRGSSSLLEEQAQRSALALKEVDVAVEIRWAEGDLVKAVLREMSQMPQAMLVISDKYRPIWRRWVRFGRFRRLQASLSSPILRVRDACWPLQNIIVCSGGLPYTIPVERLATRMAKTAGARLTFLHVVEPVMLDYPLAKEIHSHWEHLLQTDTPQARHLKQALDFAGQIGVEARVVVRHGLILHEILDEIRSGGYDLVGMGSTYSSTSLSRLFRPDVTALVSAAVDCPLLTQRGSAENSEEV